MSDPALDSNVWQAYAANPAHQATRTLSGMVWRQSSSGASTLLLPKKSRTSAPSSWPVCWPTKAAKPRSAPLCGVLAEIIASDVSLLVTFNNAIDGVIQNNPKARANPKALAQLDGYKRPLVSSLSGNLQRFGMERVGKVESLQEIIAEMAESGDNPTTASSE